MICAIHGGILDVATTKIRYSIEDLVYVTMSDGIELAATVYTPLSALGNTDIHTILVRTPYRRRDSAIFCRILAQVGYRVVVQDTRGRWDSGGTFADTFLGSEKSDGYDTVQWIHTTYPGCKIGMFGMSYLGYCQWAAAAALLEKDGNSDAISCIVPIGCSSDFETVCFQDGAMSLDFVTRWMTLTFTMGRTSAVDTTNPTRWYHHLMATIQSSITNQIGSDTIYEPDMARERLVGWLHGILGTSSESDWRDTMDIPNLGDSRFWAERCHTTACSDAPSCQLVTGWYDFCLESTLADYQIVRTHDPTVRLTIGPWHHMQMGYPTTMNQLLLVTLDHFQERMPACRPRPTTDHTSIYSKDPLRPVLVFLPESRRAVGRFWTYWSYAYDLVEATISSVRNTVPGSWISLVEWPPPESVEHQWWMSANGCLVTAPDAHITTRGSVSYRFDPSDPTPSTGCDRFHLWNSGLFRIKDNRPDIVYFTSDVFETRLVLLGRMTATIHCDSIGAESVDYVVRLCDVHPDGTVVVFREGIRRVQATMKSRDVSVVIGSVGHVLSPGHRLRIQICSGAYPRWTSNDGYTLPRLPGIPRGSLGSTHRIHYNPGGSSATSIILPVYPLGCV